MRVSRPLTYLAGLIVCLASPQLTRAQYDGAAALPAAYQEGFLSINQDDAKKWLDILAGENFAGRGTGQPGYHMAAHWVAGKLAEWGWEPIGENGTYFQSVPMTRVMADPQGSSIIGPGDLKISDATDIAFTSTAEQAELQGKVVLARIRGGQAVVPDDVSVEGKILLVVADGAGQRWSRQLFRRRPAAVVTVVKGAPHAAGRLAQPGQAGRSTGRVEAELSVDAAKRLVQACGGDPASVEPLAEDGVAIQELQGDVTIQLRMMELPAPVPNVVAWFAGSDPNLRHEHVVIGAHLDHLGVRGGDVYWGADDNGSGSTAILLIARAIALSPEPPKRSVLFISFSAEELGLVGSRYYANNPIKPLEHMQCLFNMDMVGRNEEQAGETAEENEGSIHLVGSQKIPSTLHDMVLEANQFVNFRFEYDEEERVALRSDQASFINKGIPAAFLFGGFSPPYHQPTDHPETINHHKIVSAARLNYLTLMMACERGVQKTPPPSEDPPPASNPDPAPSDQDGGQ